NQLGCH
ncbi:hypothetical protein D030_2317B, partial [Vibrio parahaemolyticus AQ3810]